MVTPDRQISLGEIANGAGRVPWALVPTHVSRSDPRQSEAFSLGFVSTRTVEAAVMFVGVLALLALVRSGKQGRLRAPTVRRWQRSVKRSSRSGTGRHD